MRASPTSQRRCATTVAQAGSGLVQQLRLRIRGENAMAQYFGDEASAGRRLTWSDFIDAQEELQVRFSKELLSSDEAIVAVFAHEMHEINGLRAIFDVRETISAVEIFRLINPGIKGNLHDQAWDVADELVARMRATVPGEVLP